MWICYDLFDPTQLWGQFSKHLMLEQWWVLVHDTHGYLGSHCNMVAYSQFSLMPRNKPKAFFQKIEWFYEEDGLALLRNPENMSYDSTTEAHLKALCSIPLSATNTSYHCSCCLYSSGWQSSLHYTALTFSKIFFILSLTQNRQFFRSCGKRVEK